MIGRLITAGVDVFRLNFSHGSAQHHQLVAERIRKQARRERRLGVATHEHGHLGVHLGEDLGILNRYDARTGDDHLRWQKVQLGD